MTLNNNDDTQEKIQLYFDNKTYAYIKELSGDKKENFFNGFINKIFLSHILFFDVILKQPIPIRKEDIKALDPSRSFKISYEEAIKIYEEFLKTQKDEERQNDRGRKSRKST